MTDDENITKLPVRFKTPQPPDRTLLLPYEVGGSRCFHQRFVIDPEKAEVECGDCHERLNPMWVLAQLAHRDHRFHEAHHRYADEMRRLEERTRTKCFHCGRMTRIRRSR